MSLLPLMSTIPSRLRTVSRLPEARYRYYMSCPYPQCYPCGPNIRADNPHLIPCVLVFLTMAEWMHLYYSRLTPEALRERIYAIGPHTFSVLAAIPHRCHHYPQR